MIVSIIDNNNEQFGLRKEIFSYEPNRFEHKTLESNEWIFDLTRDRLIVQCNYFTANKTIKVRLKDLLLSSVSNSSMFCSLMK